ncbi:hypothetical protein [Enterococcus casseliflavus]|nr:hypothetical protein [Enterococcus casseliflavus]
MKGQPSIKKREAKDNSFLLSLYSFCSSKNEKHIQLFGSGDVEIRKTF